METSSSSLSESAPTSPRQLDVGASCPGGPGCADTIRSDHLLRGLIPPWTRAVSSAGLGLDIIGGMFLARGAFAFPKFIDIGYDGGSPALDTWAQATGSKGAWESFSSLLDS